MSLPPPKTACGADRLKQASLNMLKEGLNTSAKARPQFVRGDDGKVEPSCNQLSLLHTQQSSRMKDLMKNVTTANINLSRGYEEIKQNFIHQEGKLCEEK